MAVVSFCLNDDDYGVLWNGTLPPFRLGMVRMRFPARAERLHKDCTLYLRPEDLGLSSHPAAIVIVPHDGYHAVREVTLPATAAHSMYFPELAPRRRQTERSSRKKARANDKSKGKAKAAGTPARGPRSPPRGSRAPAKALAAEKAARRPGDLPRPTGAAD